MIRALLVSLLLLLAPVAASAQTLLFSPNSLPLAGSCGTVTANAPCFDATQTWNNAGITFYGFRLNVTNTASATPSYLMDLQVGGVSQFSVGKDGTVTLAGTGIRFGGTAAGNPYFRVSGANMDLVAGDGSVYRNFHMGQAQFNSGTIILDTANGVAVIQTSANGQPAVSGLPTCNATSKGGRAMVTDATVAAATNFGVAVTGGGANNDPVYCDGTSWKIG